MRVISLFIYEARAHESHGFGRVVVGKLFERDRRERVFGRGRNCDAHTRLSAPAIALERATSRRPLCF
jgi:hypothetical protein